MRHIVFASFGAVVFCSQVFPQEAPQPRPPAAVEPGKVELVVPRRTPTAEGTPALPAQSAGRDSAAKGKKSAPAARQAREGDPRELFARANRFYESGNYEKALAAYDALLQRGFFSGNLYYNIGNTYFKLDDKGRAILFYKKALKLMPRDQDLKSNLEYALSLIEDKIEPRPRPWLAEGWRRAIGYFTLRELVVAVEWAYWLLCAVMIVFIYARSWRRILLRIAGVLFLICALMMAGAFSRSWLEGQEEAVIIAKEAKVRYGPSDKDVIAFVLHEGSVAEIENRKGDWYQVSLPDGKAGWLERKWCGLI